MTYKLINKVATINCDDIERKELFIALEKQIQKKPKMHHDFKVGILPHYEGDCPVCGYLVESNLDKFCSECGQALNWE